VSALRGFFRSITLGAHLEQSLQDLLRLLTLWFRYGSDARVDAALTDGFALVHVDTWLLVIPQIIARINAPEARVRRSVQNLLLSVGRQHPQALIYPLAVASHESNGVGASAGLGGATSHAEQTLTLMRAQCDTLVEQALLVSNELIRVAILWSEQWHEAIELAYRSAFRSDTPNAAQTTLALLAPLYAKLDAGPSTSDEAAFANAFSSDLRAARELCTEAMRTQSEEQLQAAWTRLYEVLRHINRALQETRTLHLTDVSPRLAAARDLEIAVPGTYRANAPVVAIRSFAPTVRVMNSKQRPRKLAANGDDSVEYVFLLKGHEDLRQDERVMQLFGLVNTLLASTDAASGLDLCIQRYSVVPLSTNSGLIEWVPRCDTLHTLVRAYRQLTSVLLNLEHKLMLHFAPDLEHLTLLQRMEAFEHVLSNTEGMDLYRVLWMKAPSSETWLERRSAFSRSLAVMSMVGHILGLGDRHPSNLMLHRYTGKILHIDFGDCFEVAMRREKFPEMVPFRLTRMLVKAMEVSGVEGTFRSTSETVLSVLRRNKDSVMAMLEAFIHDPLIKWRLLHSDYTDDAPAQHATSTNTNTSTLANVDQIPTSSNQESHASTAAPPNAPDMAVALSAVPTECQGSVYRQSDSSPTSATHSASVPKAPPTLAAVKDFRGATNGSSTTRTEVSEGDAEVRSCRQGSGEGVAGVDEPSVQVNRCPASTCADRSSAGVQAGFEGVGVSSPSRLTIGGRGDRRGRGGRGTASGTRCSGVANTYPSAGVHTIGAPFPRPVAIAQHAAVIAKPTPTRPRPPTPTTLDAHAPVTASDAGGLAPPADPQESQPPPACVTVAKRSVLSASDAPTTPSAPSTLPRASLPKELVSNLEESFGYTVDPLRISEGLQPTPLSSLRQKQKASREVQRAMAAASLGGQAAAVHPNRSTDTGAHASIQACGSDIPPPEAGAVSNALEVADKTKKSGGEASNEPHALNERAVRVIRRVDNKLTGREFGEQLEVAAQVQRLIEQATSNQNLCQCYIGWCPWW